MHPWTLGDLDRQNGSFSVPRYSCCELKHSPLSPLESFQWWIHCGPEQIEDYNFLQICKLMYFDFEYICCPFIVLIGMLMLHWMRTQYNVNYTEMCASRKDSNQNSEDQKVEKSDGEVFGLLGTRKTHKVSYMWGVCQKSRWIDSLFVL